MSRLFSRLENIGAGPGDSGPSAADGESAVPAASPAEVGAAPPSAAATPSILPGYTISSRLAIAPAPPVPPSVWPVRLWFFSLVFLIALSLLMLALPERLYSPSSQRQAPAAVRPKAAPLTPAPAAPTTAAVVETAPPPARVQAPAPPPPRLEPRVIAAPAVPVPLPAPIAAQPAVPAGSAQSCSEAMRALNLCSSSSP